MLNKKFKIEDALNATRSAIEEGIVEGGGMALWRVGNRPITRKPDEIPDDYKELATKILLKAIKYPFWQIIHNAGYCPDDVTKELREHPVHGFNSKEGIYCDLVENGIIDPIKVIRCAMENAISSASMLLTTEATIAEESPKEEKKARWQR